MSYPQFPMDDEDLAQFVSTLHPAIRVGLTCLILVIVVVLCYRLWG